MTKVTFITPGGSRRECLGDVGQTLMAVARDNAITGVEAECGGSLSCGTCHVYIENAVPSVLSAPSADEDEIIGVVAAERKPQSRMACQVNLTSDLLELVVRVPETQF